MVQVGRYNNQKCYKQDRYANTIVGQLDFYSP